MEVSLLKTAACVAASTSPFVEALKTLTEATHPLLTALDSVGRCVVPQRDIGCRTTAIDSGGNPFVARGTRTARRRSKVDVDANTRRKNGPAVAEDGI